MSWTLCSSFFLALGFVGVGASVVRSAHPRSGYLMAAAGLLELLTTCCSGLTTPDILHWTFSGKIVFMAVLGGFRTFVGPIVGAVVYNYLESYAVGYTVYWQLFLGVILFVLVLSLPTGIVGTVERLIWRRRSAAGVETPGA